MILDQLWRHRAKSIVAAIAVHVLLGYALLSGLGAEALQQANDSLKVFTVAEEIPPPLPPPPPPPQVKAKPDAKEEGAASPPNIKSRATAIVAPEPIVKLPLPPPVIATATIPWDGANSTTGAAEIVGPGTGAGGIGNGTGSGTGGDGTGSGGLPPVPARLIKGRISPKDYPKSAADAYVEGSVGANVYIGRNGRVTRCVVKISSGNQALDDTTCRLIKQRFRYRPARGSDGRPAADIAGWEQRWWLGRR
ncbi:TonB family protein [Novosphingopyxis sp.]|uniref:TonB family protein n=1 Tax=Novosphingopyxis sp. TaxID=2709690 RepID=UPI003B596341